MRAGPVFFLLLALFVCGASSEEVGEPDARQIVRDAWNQVRGLSSYAEITMTIHRPSWERSVSIRAWTRGEEQSLVRVTAPKKDRGNGTLIDDNKMWSFAPKVNRVIKIPSSMMGQSWMGSDFSNKDVSRADDIVDEYDHTLVGREEHEGQIVHVIESVPHETAAVVWGKELLRIREDSVLLSEQFYDQEGRLVKELVSHEIGKLGGRVMPTRQRMSRVEAADEWTEIRFDSIRFDVDLKDSLFTLSNLRNPRE
jgi:outer membrane lipoprotein-sorting protein